MPSWGMWLSKKLFKKKGTLEGRGYTCRITRYYRQSGKWAFSDQIRKKYQRLQELALVSLIVVTLVTVEFLNLHCRSDNPLFRLFDKIYQVSDFRTERNNIFDSSQGIFQTGTALINLPVTFSYIIDHIFGEMAFFSQDQSIDSIKSPCRR